jgi:hypothetical protein
MSTDLTTVVNVLEVVDDSGSNDLSVDVVAVVGNAGDNELTVAQVVDERNKSEETAETPMQESRAIRLPSDEKKEKIQGTEHQIAEISSPSTPEHTPRSILKRHSSVGSSTSFQHQEMVNGARDSVEDGTKHSSLRGVSFSQNVTIAEALDKGDRFRCKYHVRLCGVR